MDSHERFNRSLNRYPKYTYVSRDSGFFNYFLLNDFSEMALSIRLRTFPNIIFPDFPFSVIETSIGAEQVFFIE
jgi:hypothetical protein